MNKDERPPWFPLSRRDLMKGLGTGALTAGMVAGIPTQVPGWQGGSASRREAPSSGDVLDLLRWMVQVDTSNPPLDGKSWRETELNGALAGTLQREGISVQVIESAPGRGNLVARLKGDGRRKPLLLTTHVDVVGADPGGWSHPPFAAHTESDLLYGRGCLDNKGMAAALVAVVLRLAERKTPLARDVIFCLVADEESGGIQGMKFLTERHWEEIASEIALGEGDPPLLKDGRVAYIPIQCGEKKSWVVRLRAKGTPGHASTPIPDNSILLLAGAVARLGPYSTSLHIGELAREYLRRVANFEPPQSALAIREVAERGQEASAEALAAVARTNPVYNAVLRATVCPTLLQAGTRPNVIPGEAEATLNVRLLPDQKIEDVVAELRHLIASDHVDIDVVPRSSDDGPATPHDTPAFRVLEDVSSALWPKVVTVPYLAPAASDARYLRARGTMVYGVFPFPATYEEFMTIHGADERIRISSLRQGTEWLFNAVAKIAGA